MSDADIHMTGPGPEVSSSDIPGSGATPMDSEDASIAVVPTEPVEEESRTVEEVKEEEEPVKEEEEGVRETETKTEQQESEADAATSTLTPVAPNGGEKEDSNEASVSGNGGVENGAVEAAVEEDIKVEALPEDASETIYVHNLNETIKLDNLKQTLLNLFKPYRPIPPVVAHHSMRMRGQAFVSFPDKESANRAKKEVDGFPLYGKPMQISFAKSRSDIVVSKVEGEEGLESHKKQRLEHKKESRNNNPIREKERAKHKAALAAAAAPATDTVAPGVVPTAQKRNPIQMPDEYLPPNKVLFLQNLPEGTGKEDLQEVFEQHPNLLEVRLIPTRKDIAFVEYADEPSAIVAKEALHNFKIDGETKMKVTYARK